MTRRTEWCPKHETVDEFALGWCELCAEEISPREGEWICECANGHTWQWPYEKPTNRAGDDIKIYNFCGYRAPDLEYPGEYLVCNEPPVRRVRVA